MPLVITCGKPCSGKSKVSQELKNFLENEKKVKVTIVSENELVEKPNEVYTDANKEKQIRSSIKSAVQRNLNQEDVVILDALNYIKGYRYELYCLSKELKTTHCVIECSTTKDEAMVRNETYEQKVLDELWNRYEVPESHHRWDSPLFVVTPTRSLDAEQVYQALFTRKAPPPNQSTQSQPLSDTNFLYELNEKTKEMVDRLLRAQENGQIKDIAIPGTGTKMSLPRPVTMGELNRLRRQFITYTKLHPINSNHLIGPLFIQYLSKSVE